MSEGAMEGTGEDQQPSFVIFADGSGADDEGNVGDQEDGQQLSIGDDGITIVVTPENEQQVSELLRALQASQGEEVRILTESGNEAEYQPSNKEESSADETLPSKGKKRGRKTKAASPASARAKETANKKAKMIELALQEAESSVSEGISNLKSSRLREKEAKGGLKKLWLNNKDVDEEEEPEDDVGDEHMLNVEAELGPSAEEDETSSFFKCEECTEVSFMSLEELKDHRKEIHPATFHCDICGIGFEDQIGFFEHLKTHYEKPKLAPSSPAKTLTGRGRGRPRKNAVQPSTASKSDDPDNSTCDTCGKEFRNAKALDAHVRNAHPDAVTKAYHCAQCNTSFRFKEAMMTHVENVHGASEGVASESGVAGGSGQSTEAQELDGEMGEGLDEEVEGAMGEDEEVEEEEDGEGEEDEDEDAKDDEDLEALAESGVADYDPAIDGHCCQLCGAVFSAKKRLIQHLKEDHHIGFKRGRRPKYPPMETADDGSFPCPVCQRTFTHKNSLAYHVRTHAGERPHQCEICGKSFFANGALKVHMRVHTGARPYKCDECGREFRQWGDLKYHFTSLHSGVKQYQCEFCGKSFARKYSLIVHRRVHTGERNYKCEFCGKGFRASSYLLNHRRIHTGEKPHPCPVCFKPFRMRSDMKRHMQMHARDGSDVGLLLACAEQGIDPLEAITADPDALAALREKTAASLAAEGGSANASSSTGKATTTRRRKQQPKNEEAVAVATIQQQEEEADEEEGSVMLTIVPNEDGEMVAVPVRVQQSGEEDGEGDEDGSKTMEVHMDDGDGTEFQEGQEVQELQLIANEDGEVQEGLEAVTMRDPNTNTLYVWSVLPNSASMK